MRGLQEERGGYTAEPAMPKPINLWRTGAMFLPDEYEKSFVKCSFLWFIRTVESCGKRGPTTRISREHGAFIFARAQSGGMPVPLRDPRAEHSGRISHCTEAQRAEQTLRGSGEAHSSRVPAPVKDAEAARDDQQEFPAHPGTPACLRRMRIEGWTPSRTAPRMVRIIPRTLWGRHSA